MTCNAREKMLKLINFLKVYLKEINHPFIELNILKYICLQIPQVSFPCQEILTFLCRKWSLNRYPFGYLNELCNWRNEYDKITAIASGFNT